MYHRPTPEELKELLPGVYGSLSEEAKENTEGGQRRDATALFRVYASLLMATAEQLMIVEKVRERKGNEL